MEENAQTLVEMSQQKAGHIPMAINKVEYCRIEDLVDMVGTEKPIRIEHYVAPTINPISRKEIEGTVSFIMRLTQGEYNTLMGWNEPEFAIADLDDMDAALRDVDT